MANSYVAYYNSFKAGRYSKSNQKKRGIEMETKEIKVTEFYIKKSDFNKQLFILIAKAEDGAEWVVTPGATHGGYLVPYDQSVDYKDFRANTVKPT